MRRFRPSFETHTLALIALILYACQGRLIFHPDPAQLIAAGCRHGESFQCRLIYEHSGFMFNDFFLIVLTATGIYACIQIVCGKISGLKLLIVLFALQIPVISTANQWYFLPCGFNFYYLHSFVGFNAGINILALILCFNAIGRLRNAKRR